MDSLSKIKVPIALELEEFKRLFDLSLESSNPLLQQISAHIREKRGKMMRPILIILFARLHGAVTSSTYDTAVSLELLHTASLIHDDVVDNSKERRGLSSVNALYDNQIAVLSGDYLLATSLRYASLTKKISIIDIISQLGRDLSDGELYQLNNVNTMVFSEDDYFKVIRKKTAALFSACSMTGSLSVNDNLEDAEFARQIGEYMGISFQIRDDIFDFYKTDVGKPTYHDLAEGKLTLPALYILNNSDDLMLKEKAVRIKTGKATIEEINDFVSIIRANGGIEYAESRMKEYHDKAFELLSTLPESEIKHLLISYLDYIVERDY
jgi:octaprenyl-diphosphate synthase